MAELTKLTDVTKDLAKMYAKVTDRPPGLDEYLNFSRGHYRYKQRGDDIDLSRRALEDIEFAINIISFEVGYCFYNSQRKPTFYMQSFNTPADELYNPSELPKYVKGEPAQWQTCCSFRLVQLGHDLGLIDSIYMGSSKSGNNEARKLLQEVYVRAVHEDPNSLPIIKLEVDQFEAPDDKGQMQTIPKPVFKVVRWEPAADFNKYFPKYVHKVPERLATQPEQGQAQRVDDPDPAPNNDAVVPPSPRRRSRG